jgi:hypothetical protein
MPVVIVPLRPNGLPIDITCSPGLTAELAIGSGTTFSCEKSPVICSTAMSALGSFPTTFAEYVFPSVKVTSALVAPSITW